MILSVQVNLSEALGDDNIDKAIIAMAPMALVATWAKMVENRNKMCSVNIGNAPDKSSGTGGKVSATESGEISDASAH